MFKINFIKKYFFRNTFSAKQFGPRSGPTVGPDLGPNGLQWSSADDTSMQRVNPILSEYSQQHVSDSILEPHAEIASHMGRHMGYIRRKHIV